MELRTKNNKAFIGILYFIIFAVIILMVSVMFIYIGNTTKTELHNALDNKSHDNVNYSQTIDKSIGGVTTAYASLPWISLFIIVGMIFAIFISSYFVTYHPIVFIPYIIFLSAVVIASTGIVNAYETAKSETTLASTFNLFIGSNFLMSNLHILVTIIGFIGGIIMVVKMKSTSGGEYGYG